LKVKIWPGEIGNINCIVEKIFRNGVNIRRADYVVRIKEDHPIIKRIGHCIAFVYRHATVFHLPYYLDLRIVAAKVLNLVPVVNLAAIIEYKDFADSIIADNLDE